ncbi:tRNA (adenosine(37)-N6)-threonylcarbamoyltransferase complex transferase subunit TsaD, partial [Candidatus Peregrinibacteria bacterium]|nr:tRNA (adenosine(37)-N6)-threonylcarbamoyltransferase complex transferase subunit TsaD [Candidatus Peregrinibacteria bacterium]
ETACAVVEDGKKVLANTIASQIDIHAKTGGVVPEVAAREHVLKMIPVLDECLKESSCDWDDIDALAITKGPGLISSLIIGTETANVISYVKKKPLIPVQHITGHIYSNWLDTDEEIEFPVLILTVSGGHNELILMKGHHEFEVLGESRDDASGEAFDKVARILGLGYPGGPVISKIAEEGDGSSFSLPRAYLEKGSLDFSFSGLKTAVLTEVKEYAKARNIENAEDIDQKFKADLAASFQEAVVEILANKLYMAFEKYSEIKEVHLAGGVSANSRLREVIQEKFDGKITFRHPKSIKYCTDNAAMIASAAYFLHVNSPEKYKPCSNIIPTTSFEIF